MVCDEMGFGCFVGRTGELNAAELENLMAVVANPRQFKIPDWFLNRKKDYRMESTLMWFQIHFTNVVFRY
jgi:hypothetical protein